MKKLFGVLCASFTLLVLSNACGDKKEYNLQGNVGEEIDNVPVLLISLSSGDTLAIDTVRNGKFFIKGDVTKPELAQVRIGGRASGNLVLEPGTIKMDSESVGGTPLNETLNVARLKMKESDEKAMEIRKDSLINDSIKASQIQTIYEAMQVYKDSLTNANIDNPIGAIFFIESAYELSLDSLQQTMQAHPTLQSYEKLNKILSQKQIAAETSVGQPYKDFEITYNGETTKLSDLMVPGHYTLVDFWASWCGPCRREIPVIKEIKEQWGPKGLDVVGVAVWDEPANTEKAVKDLGIDWPVIYDAQTIPTDIYGILGIPCIILINPEGIIVSRDLGGQELKDKVAEVMSE